MDAKQKKSALKRLRKVEAAFWKAESDISNLTELIQPLFDEEIVVCPSTDGAIITTDHGEIGFVRDVLNAL